MKKFTSLAKKIICLMLCLTIIATPIIQDPVGSDLPAGDVVWGPDFGTERS